MAYDLEEQEQLETLKAWWRQYGTMVVVAATAAMLSIAAWQGWRYYTNQQAVSAAVLYDQMSAAVQVRDHKKVRDIAAQLVDRYPRTQYAGMAALASAKAAFETGDLPAARTQLQWVVDKGRENEMRDVARLRLAGVLIDEKNPDAALKALDAKPVEAFAGLFAEARGDIFVVQGKPAEARGAYQTALEKSEQGSPHRRMIEVKLDALGEAK